MRTTPLIEPPHFIHGGDTLSVRAGCWNGNPEDRVCFNCLITKDVTGIVSGTLTYIDEGIPKTGYLKLYNSHNDLLFGGIAFLQCKDRTIVAVTHVGKATEKV